MKLKTILSPSLVSMHLKGNTKEEIIRELLGILEKNGKISDTETVLSEIMVREQEMSTGIQYGVAIPHVKTRSVKSLVACIGLKPEGVDFQSLDGEPSNLFIMTISPIDRVGPHVQFLAEISKVIKTADTRKRLLNAKTPEEVLAEFGV
ncbi:PTS sugar transporter subunit IIA [uncultured Sphaerochaeta sp.]|uniref:PTS sugar transporter subunit IIA n=1 Tax=uncultured Sphaerochaeta sp. TaxID=886478 RepID=UPI002A0A9D4C|nr:PTS sugar transporter subunit IIA [uncultured Sphaerochaeta sp.]